MRATARVLAITAAAAVLIAVGGARPAGAGPIYQPDGAINKAGSMNSKGEDIYNTTADGQTVSATRAVGQPAKFVTSFQNDGNASDVWNYKGPGGNGQFKVKYKLEGTNYTSAVKDGELYSLLLMPGEVDSPLTIKITPKSGAPLGAAFSAKLKSTSQNDGTQDAVKAKVTVGLPGE